MQVTNGSAAEAQRLTKEAQSWAAEFEHVAAQAYEAGGVQASADVGILEEMANESAAFLKKIKALHDRLAIAGDIVDKKKITRRGEFDLDYRATLLTEVVTYDDSMGLYGAKIFSAYLRAGMAA